MSLIRFAGRALFSAPYVVDGYQMITRPEHDEEQISAAVDRVVPFISSVLPDPVAGSLPVEPRTWTRLFGGLQMLGGITYASGFGRRAGAWLLVLATLPKLGSSHGLLTDLGLLGGAVVATQDTAGKPSLAWRAAQSRKSIGSQATQTSRSAHRISRKFSAKAGKLGEVGARKARKVAKKMAKELDR
ncbi:hypothetical protein HMPREF1531_01973 [Propionibacterium sp. oral taxon 192 str. F0372]|uniref:DoxX family membrane protein n=1 Tax=Propionibacterium sp. oral taxon 192 TaxID=671222 RepID=UPI000352F364|nr:DoxX family membrane protein [Propionibacterium sp. oral taxon 192]EPH02663.1 hypothetical protein HMPREF1531_01973 [Propionibacterium sp. oral taxon 192 str. F0372]